MRASWSASTGFLIRRVVAATAQHGVTIADMPSQYRALLIGCLAPLIVVVDLVYPPLQAPRPLAALLDESAHFVTGLVLIAWFPHVRPSTLWAAAFGAVLIDLDHLPLEAGWWFLTLGTNRPYTHSLIAVGVLLLLSTFPMPRTHLLFGAAVGLLSHLIRDMATGGVPLFWPLAASRVTIPYAGYAAVILVAAVVLLLVSRRSVRG